MSSTFSRDISLAKLRSTAWVRNPQGISTLMKKGWLLLVLWQLPHALLKAIVWAFLATKSFAAGSSTYPCHMAFISKSVPRNVISLSNCRPQWHRSAMDVTRNSWGWSLSIPFLRSSEIKYVKKYFHGTTFTCGFLVEKKGRRSQYFNKTGLLRNVLLVNQKKSGSCRCVCRKLRIEWSSCNCVTCFLNGCCDVGSLVETALRPLNFLLEVLGGGSVSPRCKGHPK